MLILDFFPISFMGKAICTVMSINTILWSKDIFLLILASEFLVIFEEHEMVANAVFSM